jgi:hypothetical protein
MSNALAIAAVTETLVQFLADTIVGPSQQPDAWVSSVTPDQAAGLASPGVNVFLYQVTPNVANRNADLPTRAADGTLLQKPQLALDLHYLLTFYGDDSALVPQRLLGATMLALHRTPVMARSLIQPAPIKPLSAMHQLTSTADSGLAVQSQLIRFTPVSYSLEELSKLWSFLLKVDYVLSVAYLASVVLIEADDPASAPAPPVLTLAFDVMPLAQPVIAAIANATPGAPAITAGAAIAVTGSNLAAGAGALTQVAIAGQPPLTPNVITPGRLELVLPAGLAAGTNSATVVQPLLLGSPPVAHAGTGAMSGVFPFVLVPQIVPGSAQVLAQWGAPPGRALQLGVVPTARAGQRVLALLTGGSPPAPRLIDGGSLGADSDTLTFALPTLAPGSYLVQVLVDGAQSSANGPVVVL